MVVEVGGALVASAGGDQEIDRTLLYDSAGEWNGPVLSSIHHNPPSDHTLSQCMSSVMVVVTTVIAADPFVCRAGGTLAL